MASELESLLSASESEAGLSNPGASTSTTLSPSPTPSRPRSAKSEPDLITFSPPPPPLPPNNTPAHQPTSSTSNQWTFTLYNFDNHGFVSKKELEGLASSICEALSAVGVEAGNRLQVKVSLTSQGKLRQLRKRYRLPRKSEKRESAILLQPPPPPDPEQKRPRSFDVLHLSQVSACCRAHNGSYPLRHCERHCHCSNRPSSPPPSHPHQPSQTHLSPSRQAATAAAYYQHLRRKEDEERSLASTHFFASDRHDPPQRRLYQLPL